MCRCEPPTGGSSRAMDHSYRVTQPEVEVEQDGVAAKLMAMMGYQKGTGLGKCKSNPFHPIALAFLLVRYSNDVTILTLMNGQTLGSNDFVL